MKYLAILGRQPELSLAEFERLYGPDMMLPLSPHACLLENEPDLSKLGGTIKVSLVLFECTHDQLAANVFDYIKSLGITGKLKLGFSFYGSFKDLNKSKFPFKIKKQLVKFGMSVRLIDAAGKVLNAAQITHNQLMSDKGVELLLHSHNNKITVAKTISVQNIDSFSQRDRQKPVRDTKVGMLPPKLAKLMVNLSGQSNPVLLDPFCGTGTVLIEAIDNGSKQVFGSDNAESMVKACKTNLDWYTKQITDIKYSVINADATMFQWANLPDVIVGETWLGPPLSSIPDPARLNSIIDDVNQIISSFLGNIVTQLSDEAVIVIAIPVWKNLDGYIGLPLVDSLDNLGYNHLSLKHVNKPLIYRRPDQIVGRQILILRRK